MAVGANKRTNRALFRKSNKGFSVGLFILASMAFILIERSHYPGIAYLRSVLDELFAQPIAGVRLVISEISDGTSFVGDIINVHSENNRLKEEVERLRNWRATAEALGLENKRLQDALKAHVIRQKIVATPRVISMISGAYARGARIYAGLAQGLENNMTVVDGQGLVGRVMNVGISISEILLITDLNSRIPVRIERSRQNGIAAGSNEALLSLEFLPLNPDVQVGDRVLTSGDGGVFAPDLLVGTVEKIEDDRIYIKPASRLNDLNFVTVVTTNAQEDQQKQEEQLEKNQQDNDSQDKGDR